MLQTHAQVEPWSTLELRCLTGAAVVPTNPATVTAANKRVDTAR